MSMLYSSILVIAVVNLARSQQRACIYVDTSSNQLANMAHQIQQSGSCIACLPECTTCTSETDQTCSNGNCQSSYYYDSANKQCLTCPSMCEECINATSCLNCIQGYYLDSTTVCRPCTTGVAFCTSASILQCSDGYYYDSQAYVCRKCADPSCTSCSGKTNCASCQSGFMLSSDGTSCSSCQVVNCEQCVGVGVCVQCRRGYWLQGSSSCTKQSCTSINRCEQCETSTSGLTCTLCQPGFYLLNNTCNFGVSMLCGYSLTPKILLANQRQSQQPMNRMVDFGSCLDCNQALSKQASHTENYCLPKLVGSNSESYVSFRSEVNFLLCRLPYLTISTPASLLNYSYRIPPSFKFTLTAVIIIINGRNITSTSNFSELFAISMNLNHSVLGEQLQTYPLACYNQTVNSTSLILKILVSHRIETGLSQSPSSLQSLNISIRLRQSGDWQMGSKQVYLQVSLCRTTNCVQCISASSCTKCMLPYFIQNFDCVMSCAVGYYVNNATRTCRSDCESGYFPDLASTGLQSYCLPCPLECITCKSLIVCSQCSSGYFLTIDGKCSRSCSSSSTSEYYPSPTDHTCKKCENPCRTCDANAYNCTSCLVGFHYSSLSSGVCLLVCPTGFYPSTVVGLSHEINSKCLVCDAACLSCQIDKSICTSCQANLYLLETSCLNKCPNGYLGLSLGYGDSPICRKCVAPCSFCLGSEDNCTTCQFALYLMVKDGRGICMSNCPSGSYGQSISKSCIPCSLHCNQCFQYQAKQFCTYCQTGFYLENGQCVASCSNGWTQGSVCESCPYPCQTCTLLNASYVCSSCVQGYYLHSSTQTCLLLCPIGSYGDWQKHVCSSCPSQCAQCSMDFNQTSLQCNQCSFSYYLFNKSCLDSCPSRYFSLNRKCEPCFAECLECSITESRCTKCRPNQYLLSKSGECLDSCPHSYYADNLNKLCMECSKQCSQCSATSTNCTLCTPDYFKYYNLTLQQSTCITFSICTSLLGFFPNSQTSVCETCRSPCLQCLSLSLCTQCDSNSYLFRDSCLADCPSGYYPATQQCASCSITCATCLSAGQCLTCKPNYFFSSSLKQCLQKCPQGQFGNLGSMACESCKFPCLTCNNREYCLSCNSILINQISVPLILLEGRCLTPCPDGFFTENISGDQQCRKCKNQCQTCLSLTSCSNCNFGYFFHMQSCLQPTKCPLQYFPDLNTRTCSTCVPPCLTCISRYECSTCLLGYSLKDKSCYISCPIGTYALNSTCVSCPLACARCLDPLHCLECANGAFLLSDQTNNSSTCKQQCPQGTYLDMSESVCSRCSLTCRTCWGRSNNCTTCTDQQVLQNGRCMQSCSNFYFEQSIVQYNHTHRFCSLCNQSCSRCVNSQVCLACDSAYLVTTTQSLQVNSQPYFGSYCNSHCPPTTFKDSQEFKCLPCSKGCLNCKNDHNCLQCSREQGFVLFNSNCIRFPCPSDLYLLVDDNECVQKSYCQNAPQIFNIFESDNQCYRKNGSGCPKQLVLKDAMFCVQACPQGYSVDFTKVCTRSNRKGQKFTIQSIVKEGHIVVVIKFTTTVSPDWANLFRNVTVTQGINWDQEQNRRLLASILSFSIIEPPQKYSNALTIEIFSESEILEPTDLTITISMSPPYSTEISINQLPLQNWQAYTVVKSYIVTSAELTSYHNHQSPHSAVAIILIILLVAVSMLSLLKSGKIYLLVPAWDFMQMLYFLPYFNIYWPTELRRFFYDFFVVNLKWFDVQRSFLTPSPERVYSYAIDINLLSNSLCCISLIFFSLLIYGAVQLIKKVTLNQFLKKPNEEISLNSRLFKSQLHLKILVGTCYLSAPNLLYFSMLNVFYMPSYAQSNGAVIFISVCLIILIVLGLLYCFVRQSREKSILDGGLNPLKKNIIVSLPIYLAMRKLLVIVFLALFPLDAVFPLCFGLITTTFIIILIYWFEPYKNKLRHKFSILYEISLFFFFLSAIVYVSNQELVQSGFPGFLLALAIYNSLLTLIYPVYHLYILLNLRSLLTSSSRSVGYCIQEQSEPHQNCQRIQNNKDSIQNSKLGSVKKVSQKKSEQFECSKRSIEWRTKEQQAKPKFDKVEKGKKKKLKLPKDRLIQNQTDHQADQSSQQGERKKMKLANYTVRLTKKDPPPFINNFKNYDLNANQASNDAEGLAEKQIQLSRLLQKQKNLVRNKEKALTNN